MRLAAVIVPAFRAVAAVVAIGARLPGASAAVGVGVDGHAVTGSLSGRARFNRREPLSRITVAARAVGRLAGHPGHCAQQAPRIHVRKHRVLGREFRRR